MKISQKYVDYVKKTANPNYTVEMAACALLEEAVEYNTSDTLGEFGDMLYQFVLFCQMLKFDIHKLNLNDIRNDNINDILVNTVTITSQYKKKVTRGKEIDLKLIEKCLSEIYYVIITIAKSWKLDIEDVEEENMKKLNERYGIND